jgi:hypothetical protein
MKYDRSKNERNRSIDQSIMDLYINIYIYVCIRVATAARQRERKRHGLRSYGNTVRTIFEFFYLDKLILCF